MARQDPSGHWRRTRRLALVVLAAWAGLALALPLAAPGAGGGAGGQHFGFLLASLGPLAGFVALAFWFAARQQIVDRDYAMADED